MKKAFLVAAVGCLGVIWVSAISASTPGTDTRLTNDCHPDAGCGAGYVSAYTLATGNAYTDQTLDECTVSPGRQNGRAFFGSETSGDPAGSAKTFGDEFVARYQNPGGPDAADTTKDGLQYSGTTVVAHGSSAPNLLGVFHDKTSIEVDRTGGACDGNVYFAWARFSAARNSNIYFSRSTDHGVTFSNPQLLTSQVKNVQDPSISVTGNGNV